MTRSERLERLALSFFGRPSDGSAAALFRIAFALLSAFQLIGIWLNLHRFWGHDGMIPFEVVAKDKYLWITPFAWAPKSEVVLVGHGVLMTVATAALLVGYRARVATLVIAYLHLSLQARNPFILNSGDRLFMIVAALAAFMPLSHRFGVDAWLRAKKRLPIPDASVWGQRLVGLQISYVYLNSTFAKLANRRWQSGMALRDVLASPVFAEWPMYIDNRPVIWGLTYGTLAFELLFPVLVWFKKIRPYAIVSGVLFHIGIDVTMVIPIFSYIMIVSYLAYLSDDEASWLWRKVLRVRDA